MGEVTVRQLSRHAGALVERAASGERITITQRGKPVAELGPMASAALSADELLSRWRTVPRIDQALMRTELDSIIDPSL